MSMDERFLVAPGSTIDLADYPTDADPELSRPKGEQRFAKLLARLSRLQEMMYAQGKHSLLVVLQAMDAGGKDSAIRNVFGPINPQGCRVINFKAPSSEELQHDFLWRVHANAPRAGYIHVFNRSHYEDVLIVRVKGLVPEDRWRRRYEHINAFERMLHDEGTTILKFFLHISKDYQKKRLQRRLDNPDKHWKFEPADLIERARWDDYQAAYAEALSRCSTPQAPWYVIPAEKRWYRNLLIGQTIVEKLESLGMSWPEPRFDAESIVIT